MRSMHNIFVLQEELVSVARYYNLRSARGADRPITGYPDTFLTRLMLLHLILIRALKIFFTKLLNVCGESVLVCEAALISHHEK